jgi:hypothetical protein
MKAQTKPFLSLTTPVFVLRHLDSGEYICLQHEGDCYLAAFTDGDSATTFRADLGQIEHAEIISARLGDLPTEHFWLDGEMLHRQIFTP